MAAAPTAKKDAFLEHAKIAAVVFKEHGALGVVETWGDDAPPGEVTSFPMPFDGKRLIYEGFEVILES